MTLQIMSDHVYTQLGVAISVTGIAQVRGSPRLKKQAKLFSSYLPQISTNSDNFGANSLKLYEMHSFSISPNTRQRTNITL